ENRDSKAFTQFLSGKMSPPRHIYGLDSKGLAQLPKLHQFLSLIELHPKRLEQVIEERRRLMDRNEYRPMDILPESDYKRCVSSASDDQTGPRSVGPAHTCRIRTCSKSVLSL
ncbi:unnamed protein product, partial [Symbiodinium natans]